MAYEIRPEHAKNALCSINLPMHGINPVQRMAIMTAWCDEHEESCRKLAVTYLCWKGHSDSSKCYGCCGSSCCPALSRVGSAYATS